MFLVIIILAFVMHQVAAPPTSCGPDSVWHTDSRRTQDSLCCIPVTCNPGEGPNLCNSSGAEAFCTPCDLGWYNSKTLRSAPPGGGSMELCQPFKTCREGLHKEKSAGNATHDRVCECKDGGHMGTFGECYPLCLPGKYWQKGEVSDSCLNCTDGKTFTNTSGREECSNCTSCGATKTACNITHDAVCFPPANPVDDVTQGIGTDPVTGNNDGLEPGIIALVVIIIGLLIVGAVVLVVLYICKKKQWLCWRKRSSHSSYAQRSSETAPMLSRGENGTTSTLPAINLAKPAANTTQSANNSAGPVANPTEPANNSAKPAANTTQSANNSAGPVANPTEPANNSVGLVANTTQQANNSSEPHVNSDQPDDNRAEPNVAYPANLGSYVNGTTLPDASLCQQTNLDQPSGDRNELLASGRTPINAMSGQDRGNAGQTGDLDTVDTHGGPAQNSFQCGLIELTEEDPNLKLQNVQPAVQNKKVERYDNAIQSRYNDVQKTLILDNVFLGYLFSNHVITDSEHDQLRVLKKQPLGNAEALPILRSALRRNGDKACDPFLKALLAPESRQDVIALIIDPERAEHLIRERDNHADVVAPDRIGRSKSVEDPGKESLTSIRDSVDHSNGTKTLSEETRVKRVDGSGGYPYSEETQLKEFDGSGDDPGSKETQLKEFDGSGDDPGSKETQLKEFDGSGDDACSKETQLKEFDGSGDDPGSKETQLKEFDGSGDDPGSKETQLKEFDGSGDDACSKETQLKEFDGSGDDPGSKETQLKEFDGSEDYTGSDATQVKEVDSSGSYPGSGVPWVDPPAEND